MKNTGKHLGIVVLTAVVLSMVVAAGAFGQSLPPTIQWPAESVWALYAVPGLQQPAGTQVHGEVAPGTLNIVLSGANKAAYDGIVAHIRSVGGVPIMEDSNDEAVSGMYMTGGQRIIVVAYNIKESAVAIIGQ